MEPDPLHEMDHDGINEPGQLLSKTMNKLSTLMLTTVIVASVHATDRVVSPSGT